MHMYKECAPMLCVTSGYENLLNVYGKVSAFRYII
jgi:hypothetical protein